MHLGKLLPYQRDGGVRPTTDVENYFDKMENQALLTAAAHIVARNMTPNINMARVYWSAETSHLKLAFAYDSAPSEDDLEWQELAMTELVAEFPEIVTGECLSPVSNGCESEAGLVVYSKTK